jgi:hypothetical protein
MKSNSLSNIDITNILRAQGIELNGIFMKDELPKKLKKGFYVINLASNTDNNGGTHWTAFYHGSDNYYFDAFGFIAPMEVDKRFKSYVYNTSQIQDINSTACGFYCIGFIIYMNSQKNKMEGYKSFVNLFSSDTKENDKKLYAILYK